DRDTRNLRKFGRQKLCVVMIDLKTLRSFFESDQPRCRENADLAHAASQHLANAAAPLDEWPRSNDHRTNGSAQSFAQAELHGIEFLRHVGDILAKVCRRVEDPCSIEVDGNAGLVCLVADLVCDLRFVNGSAGHVVSILERDQSGLRSEVNLRTYGFRD